MQLIVTVSIAMGLAAPTNFVLAISYGDALGGRPVGLLAILRIGYCYTCFLIACTQGN